MNETTKLPALATVSLPMSMRGDVFFDPQIFEHAQRVATMLSKSELVPKHMKSIPDIMIALNIARKMEEEPLTVLQNIYVVAGKPGWLTQYMISRCNSRRVFSKRIQWTVEGEGDKLRVMARATLADTGEEVTAYADMKMAKAEGWTKNAKYQSMPEHMLKLRSATFLIRLHVPEVMGGITRTADELEDMKYAGQLEEEDGVHIPKQRPRRSDYKPDAKPVELASEPVAEVIESSTTEPATGEDIAGADLKDELLEELQTAQTEGLGAIVEFEKCSDKKLELLAAASPEEAEFVKGLIEKAKDRARAKQAKPADGTAAA